jgi:UDP-N-acetylglucosamine/UDP-N-acetylgalactosamine diphosphorylase
VPARENALKFEKFMFDILPHANPWLLVWTSREDEFAPLKNADGADSPAAVRVAQSRLAVRWIEAAGVSVPTDGAGNAQVPIEIAPSAGLEPADLDPSMLRAIDWSRPVLLKS